MGRPARQGLHRCRPRDDRGSRGAHTRGRRGRRGSGDSCRAGGLRWLGRNACFRARRVPAQNFRGLASARRRHREGDRHRGRHAAQDGAPHPDRHARRQLEQLCKLSRKLRVRKAGRLVAGRARSDRCRRLHHAVEFSAEPDHAEGGAGSGRGLYGGTQAVRSGAYRGLHTRRGDSRGWRAQGCVQPLDGLRPGGRRGARAARGRGHDFLYRFDACGAQSRRSRGADHQARRARTRRQIGFDHPRRRGLRKRRQGHHRQLLSQFGPGLHRADAHARAASTLR